MTVQQCTLKKILKLSYTMFLKSIGMQMELSDNWDHSSRDSERERERERAIPGCVMQ